MAAPETSSGIARLLMRIELFRDLSASALEEIARSMRSVAAPADTTVIRAGEPGDSAYFIVEGALLVVGTVHGAEFVINRLRAGDFFGEMAIIDHQPRSASVRAEEDSRLLVLSHDDFHHIFEKHPRIARILLERISLRMRKTMTDLESRLDELRLMNLDLIKTYDMTLHALSRALDLRDSETEGHSQRVTELSGRIAAALGLPPDRVAIIRKGALLHDIGKIGVPDAILRKPAALDEDEMAVIRHHPRWGHDMIKDVPFLRDALPLVLHHHEKFDGSGYPSGLKGEAIPLEARIFAVVDAFDAMNSNRPYRNRLTMEEILAEFDRCAGRHFDPQVVVTLKEVLREAPAPVAPSPAL